MGTSGVDDWLDWLELLVLTLLPRGLSSSSSSASSLSLSRGALRLLDCTLDLSSDPSSSSSESLFWPLLLEPPEVLRELLEAVWARRARDTDATILPSTLNAIKNIQATGNKVYLKFLRNGPLSDRRCSRRRHRHPPWKCPHPEGARAVLTKRYSELRVIRLQLQDTPPPMLMQPRFLKTRAITTHALNCAS
eukprot:5648660-Pyramimonas_sp.AAC.1